jgi:uncharacterized membrane protein AbrB (regulator of aidB expression)
MRQKKLFLLFVFNFLAITLARTESVSAQGAFGRAIGRTFAEEIYELFFKFIPRILLYIFLFFKDNAVIVFVVGAVAILALLKARS